jgi:hypothetical protein
VGFNFDIELRSAIASFENRYGQRDRSFKILPTSFHDEPYAQILVDEAGRTIAVKLDAAAKGDDMRLKYQIWHEAVHCLAPVQTKRTLWFEEGLAVQSSLHAPHMNHDYRRLCIDQLKPYPAWYDPWRCFKRLKANDEKIKAIHEKAPERKFDLITPELILEIFGASSTLASDLCRCLGETRERR